MVEPIRAPVRPRALCPHSGEALPLEDEVRRLAEDGAGGVVALLGPAGSGKSTALCHLAAVLPPGASVALWDEGNDGPPAFDGKLLVCAHEAAPPDGCRAAYRMAPWGRDECIEYLLAAHRDRCAAVVARLRPEDDFLFRGVPELWTVVLDRLAADDAAPDARTALHLALEAQLPDTDIVGRARSACLNLLARGAPDGPAPAERVAKPGFPPGVVRVLRHPAAQLLLAAERVAADLAGEDGCDYLKIRLPRDLIEAAAPAVRADARAREYLARLLAGPPWSHAMAASLFIAADPSWAPGPGPAPRLAGAYLGGARWPGVALRQADLSGAELDDADLTGAVLVGADARKASLRGAGLARAALGLLSAAEVDLAGADLTAVQAPRADFAGADLRGAVLDDAGLLGALFAGARLAGASFRGADLTNAVLCEADLKGADFSGAKLERADLSGLRLREAAFAGAGFQGAQLRECDLEGMDLPAADFRSAGLEGALLTGCSMPGADFTAADLRGTGLADVRWEGVCLREADLTGATFHLGTTRSGLVFSPIASEGSRTGFYTDDFDEQYYKEPEEIRKANLCGADLRGANVADVDFYLVDLRGARYTHLQEKHFRRCGALLGPRT
jgi:uncharacterized protein YjbI with pentapeptide repeats